MSLPRNITELRELRDRVAVFADRAEAGDRLAVMLESYRGTEAVVLAIPAGGVPVGLRVAEGLGLAFDVAVVSKITLPWNTEVGYGAVAFDGSVRMNEALLRDAGLTDEQVRRGIDATRRKVERRVKRLRGGRPFPELAKRAVILVDDGLASGFTMRLAVEVVRKAGVGKAIVAVPTASLRTAGDLAAEADALYCANLRGGWSFAVADAYKEWRDLKEDEVEGLLTSFFSARRRGA
ncbi:MAG: phosphoribosyltransferase family protein [Verrucomicrobiota bacterium]